MQTWAKVGCFQYQLLCKPGTERLVNLPGVTQ